MRPRLPQALYALRYRDFALYTAARFAATLAWQMLSVAAGWQIYALTHDPLALGLAGLAQFLPFVTLVLPAGQVADVADRRFVLTGAYACEVLSAGLLCWLAWSNQPRIWAMYVAMALFGAGRAFWMPAGQAITPRLVPPAAFPNAVAINGTLFQTAAIGGPGVGGALYLLGPAVVYATTASLLLLAMVLVLAIKPLAASPRAAWCISDTLEGLRFVLRQRVVLGAISLDLFAVLFGGTTALLPIFAADVLQIGPLGLGILRAAPGLGALTVAAVLAIYPLKRHVGSWLFGGVVVFGVATLVFGASHDIRLSLAALFCLGGGDMVSIYVRHLLVQLQTPDAIRGRVSAVNAIFIGSSNELGEFESGVTARCFGLVPAVLLGGVATLLVVVGARHWFPELRTMDRFPAAVSGR
ncbi:MAG: MFS transporter [Gammaproteobacteria bacterium]|nr:MFS transporter [Gammaproteobacteria bacterium]